MFSASRFFEDVRVYAPPVGRTHHVQRLPDGRTAIALRLLDGGSGDLSVTGPRTKALFKSPIGIKRVVVWQFKPGWSASLLGVPAHVLTDRHVHLEELWGDAARELCLELLATPDSSAVTDRIFRAIAARIEDHASAFEPASARLARRAVRLIEAGMVRVEDVAAEMGVTARHLRRAFAEHIGVGPKDFARGVRLQRAVRMATVSADWGRIATAAGYYDQAHLIADFKDLVGLTPVAYLKRIASDSSKVQRARTATLHA
ncbi:MAG TPA: helix-turn-helix domain-containing protein [Kofleriaceae bacterium]|nr:helix-turn-helix domain-containing protein [Kofleriaceae bacterium]